jgi:hypothetical protein
MDSNIVVAATGIIGVIVGIAGTYFIQNKISKRQRKWALEDEERKIKRELLSKRLDIIEEAIGIMMNETRRAISKEMGMPTWDDKEKMKEQGIRLQSIRGEAWAALVASGSKELTQCWRDIANAHFEVEETGTLGNDLWDKAQKSYKELIKLSDSMRSLV